MRLDYLIERLLASIVQERVLLRRLSRYVLPLLLLPIGFALAQMVHGWLGFIAGGLGAGVLLAQIELFLRPTLYRAQVIDHDVQFYLRLAPTHQAPDLAPVVPLLLPSAVTLVASMGVFLPPILAVAPTWQRLLALALGAGVLWAIWQRVAQITALLDGLEARLSVGRSALPGADQARSVRDEGARRSSLVAYRASADAVPASQDGLLDPSISGIVAGLPLPALPLSPAARALLRVEAYLLLRDFPGTSERALLDALAGLAHEAHQDEERHWLLPPVGGKLYLPVTANGAVANLLGTTVRRLGMDGGYSASLATWLVRLPPARSYAVAGHLIDSLVALRLPPPGLVLPHHLTVQGDLGQESRLLSIVQLAATPLLFAERPGHALGDERPFIMRGGGVLDDMGGRGRHAGPRTDFVDGFIFVQAPDLNGVEHLAAHTINLRVKQVLAFGLLAAARPLERRTPVDGAAAAAYERLRADTRVFLERYGIGGALDLSWLDGRWSEVWPWVQRMSELKEHDAAFLDDAQRLRDAALDRIEDLAVVATSGGGRRA
jgi:hypothetical protein